jgi:glutaredoxin
MPRVTVYWAPGCHLCDPVKTTVREVCDRLGVPFEEVDIAGDAALEAAYREALPVVEIDGRRAFKYYVDSVALEERLRGAGAA